MLHTFKIYGQRFAIDKKSLAIHMLSELQFDMLRYVNLPFEDACPSSLRYDLAKYESTKISDAYMHLKKLYDDKVLFCDICSPESAQNTPLESPKPDFEVKFTALRPIFASEVIKAADSGHKIINAFCESSTQVKESDHDILFSEYERIAKEIFKRKIGKTQGNVFTFLPFYFDYCLDNKGYWHLSDKSISELLKIEQLSADQILKLKLLECSLLVNIA